MSTQEIAEQTFLNEKTIQHEMRKAGFVAKRVRRNGERVYIWVKKE